MRFLGLGFPKGAPKEYPVIDLSDPRQRRRLISFVVGILIVLLIFPIIGFGVAEYMDTSEFCGELCHSVMKPEYTAYRNSPHARVNCVNCHIGPGASWLVKSKISGTRQVVAVAFNTYSRPIPSPVEDLRPARETCEKCHWPQKFSEDRIRIYRHYLEDEGNTLQQQTLGFKVGGGDVDGATGIHWHVASKVWYLPLDEKRQEIGWVGVEGPAGQLSEYFNPSKLGEISPQRVGEDKRLMDCIDCHNRATHVFRSPEEMVDLAMARGKIDPSIPFIKKKVMEVLSGANPGPEKAGIDVQAIVSFYQANYPQIYAAKKAAISEALKTLQDIARQSVFPGMKVDWNTHPNNLGHSKSPGCFRCHGRLVTTTKAGVDRTMEGGCNLCHYPLSNLPSDSPSARAPSSEAKPTPPSEPATSGEKASAQIQAIYDKECSMCHGKRGDQVPNANLASAEFLKGRGDALLIQGMAQGKGGMPAYGQGRGGNLTDEQIKGLVDLFKLWASASAPAP